MFSVDHPFNLTAGQLEQLTFENTITNTGDFNPSTGVFTCRIPGNYYFSVSLTKLGDSKRMHKVDHVQCYLNKNNYIRLLRIRVDPTDDDTDYGNAAVSNSAIVELNRGETVALQGCHDPNTHMETWSSFTGFLE